MTDSNPLPSVDVVIATRDRPHLLRSAIESIFAQDFDGQIDVAVVFDQNVPDLSIQRQTHRRSVRVLPNTHRPGLPGARNTGMEVGSHSLIAFCDDDDEWLPGKLKAQVRRLVQQPELEFCATGTVFDHNGRSNSRPCHVSELTVERLIHHRYPEAGASSFLFRRSLWERIGPVDEAIPGGYSEDYDWLIRAARVTPIACISEPLVRVRWGSTSYFATKWSVIVDAQNYLLLKHPEFQSHRRAEARLRGQIAFAQAALGKRRAALSEIKKVIACWPFEKRWPVAALVALRLISADRALALAHRWGKGI